MTPTAAPTPWPSCPDCHGPAAAIATKADGDAYPIAVPGEIEHLGGCPQEAPTKMNGAESIAAERERQRREEGHHDEDDDQHTTGELALAGAVYAMPHAHRRMVPAPGASAVPELWPAGWAWKPSTRRRHDLVRAGALIAAEIDRLDRLDEKAER